MQIDVDFKSDSHENVTIYMAMLIGFISFLFGSLVVIAPGEKMLFFTLPDNMQFKGLLFVILGLFSMYEARNQKRYSNLKKLMKFNDDRNA